MVMAANVPLMPTCRGHVATTLDALILFEACLSGRLTHVPRRPHDRERQELIRSGNIFIYEEHASGIKRWTDGISWSPSRILGNYLIYRELIQSFPPGEKKRATKKPKRPNGGIGKSESSSQAGTNGHIQNIPAPSANDSISTGNLVDASDEKMQNKLRSLIGSLVDSYPFKDGGLVKKTISISYRGVPHHLVSYYSIQDCLEGNLVTPSTLEEFRSVRIRSELMMHQSFRAPLDEIAVGEGLGYSHLQPQISLYPPMHFVPSRPVSMQMPPPSAEEASPWIHNGYVSPTQHQSHQQMMPYHGSAPPPMGGLLFSPAHQQPHQAYTFDGQMRASMGHSSDQTSDSSRNFGLDGPRRHSTAFEMSQITQQIPHASTMPPSMATDTRHFGDNPFLNEDDIFSASERLTDPVAQAPEAFPSPHTLPQSGPSIGSNGSYSALKLESDDARENDPNGWFVPVDDDQSHLPGGVSNVNSGHFGPEGGTHAFNTHNVWSGGGYSAV